jgi:uncharacterized protein
MTDRDSSTPFIKKFKHDGLFYIYDVNTNQIVEVEKTVYDLIDRLDDTPSNRSGMSDAAEKIKNAQTEYGLFSSFRPLKVSLGIQGVDDLKKLYQKGLNQLLLEVTGNCNLNCRYCQTSGKYARPGKSQEHMSREICREALDFFCKRSLTDKKSAISFYGGEPLLRFDLIKDAVQYVQKNYDKDGFGFNLTTNGTLLNREMIDYFITNDFSLLISLDGPEKINDRYRVFKDGQGTFRTIMRNIDFLKEYDIDYYSRKVSITSVLSPPFDDVDEILDFFTTEPILEEMWTRGKIRSSLVDTRETSFIEDFGLDESLRDYEVVFDRLVERLKRVILSNNLNHLTIEKDPIFPILYKLARRPVKRLHSYTYPEGACHMGLRRVFVRTNGDFYVCERSGENYKIGNIGCGFDYERIAGYYMEFEKIFADCRYCWALIYCNRCWAHIGNLKEFNGKRREEFCAASQKMIERTFRVYVELLKQDPDCFKVFKDVMIS